MARKQNASVVEGVLTDPWMREMLDRAQLAFSHDTEQRRQVVEDMRFAFVSGNQWDTHMTRLRRNRPCYEFNRIRQLIRRVTGGQLKNKPQIKVRAVEDNDVDKAEIYNGLIKNIEVQSGAETAYDTAFQWACGGGYGVLRVKSEYEGHDTFDQCLKIETVLDPMTVYFDPTARKFDRSDAKFVFVTELIPTAEFKKRWPNAPVIDFESPARQTDYDSDWGNREEVRIAEYWYIEKEVGKLYMLSDGSCVSAEEFDPIKDEAANPPVDPATGQPAREPITIKQERVVEKDCVYCALVSGRGKLEEPSKWGGSMIPIVPQWGDFLSIDGKQHYSGMTRFGKDSQTIHNFEMSTMVEVVAKLPNSPLTATPKMVEGLEDYYERMGYDDAPVLLYNIDQASPSARPQREPMPQLPSALANLSQISTEEMKANMGVFDASIGAKSNESSGRAIIARQAEGEIANFVYIDNQMKALKRLGEILVDAIPHYYDAERSIRILGDDYAETYIEINKPIVDEQTGRVHIINDLSVGKYDVTTTVGKSFDTARMEMAEVAQALSQVPGPAGMLGQMLMFKSIDVPGIDEYVKALRKILVSQKLLEPGEGDPPPAAAPPNPKDVASAKKDAAQADNYAAQAEGKQLENQEKALQLGAQMGALGIPPPTPIQMPNTQQPPQGGFFVPGDQGFPQ